MSYRYLLKQFSNSKSSVISLVQSRLLNIQKYKSISEVQLANIDLGRCNFVNSFSIVCRRGTRCRSPATFIICNNVRKTHML